LTPKPVLELEFAKPHDVKQSGKLVSLSEMKCRIDDKFGTAGRERV
jgi:hypothetical protein